MVRRLASAILFLLVLNVMALGNGLFSIDAGKDCAAQMAHHTDQHHAPAKGGCNLPWSPGCTSVAPCVAPMMASATESAPNRLREVAPLFAVAGALASGDASPDHPPPRA